MSISHTPGPWVVIDQRDIDRGWWIGVDHPDWGVITHAEVRAGCDEADELGSMEANARLIAASPTMYDYIARKARVGDQEASKIVEAINANS